jgi:hypothetical protein
VVSETARKTKGRLRVTKFEISSFQSTLSGDSAATKIPGLTLNGVSLDNPAVPELLDGLQKSGVFKRVELLTLKEREDRDSALRDFEVRCEF